MTHVAGSLLLTGQRLAAIKALIAA